MNLGALKQAYRSPELRRRVYGRLRTACNLSAPLLMYRFRFPTTLLSPASSKPSFNSNKLLQFADVFSGSALSNFSIIMMGCGAVFNASIIMQLLGQVIPSLEALQKEGEMGRRKITKYTRILTLPLAIIQSFGMVLLIESTSKSITGSNLCSATLTSFSGRSW